MPPTIGRYEIKGELGRGGMATVYLAFDPRFQREVAIKVLPRQFTHDPRFLARFEQEARTIAALEHYAIVPVHDFGEEDDAPYLVMRYMSGGSLRERMDGQPLPLPEISRILDRLAPALDKAHRRGIIHRDLKPGNVLFDEDNQPYLADFGIARMAEATHTMTVTGTPAYMSPEQAMGQQKLDWRSDIYALGAMLFEMLSGQQPYTAQTPTGQMFMHVNEPVPDLLAANPQLPPQAQGVIDQAMAKEREERFQTAAELAGAVEAMQKASIEVEEAPPPPGGGNDAIKELTAAGTLPDTPPAIPSEEQRSTGADRSWVRKLLLPRTWWIGAAAVILLLVFGLRSILEGVSDSPEATLALDSGVPPSEPELGDVWERPKDKMPMVYVPTGTFSMGNESGQDTEALEHKVTLDGFWIDQREVTNAQYVLCVDAGDCKSSDFAGTRSYGGENYPVVGVSWHDADVYCRWVGGRLPTEAQWEYAARGPEGFDFPWGDEFSDEMAETCGEYCIILYNLLSRVEAYDKLIGYTEPVGKFPDGASWVGALDMAGNVMEWVNDWYDSNYYADSPVNNPEGPHSSKSKVLRGGSWYSDPDGLRSANRIINGPDSRTNRAGFRCASSYN